MAQKRWIMAALPALILAGVIVVMTDVWVGVFRWVNCGPVSSERSRNTEICR